MGLVEMIYASAAHVGLLQRCTWQPSDGSPAQTHGVHWSAPDDVVLDGLALSSDFVMTYPSSCFAGLAAREVVEIEGASYLVREVRALRDGTETRASLSRV